jgi:hypothetical protein
MKFMLKKFLQWASALTRKKKQQLAQQQEDQCKKDYEFLERMKRNAFHTPDLEVREKLLGKVITFSEKTKTEKEIVDDEFQTINWSDISTEGKKKLIAIAKTDIALQISMKPNFPVLLSSYKNIK